MDSLLNAIETDQTILELRRELGDLRRSHDIVIAESERKTREIDQLRDAVIRLGCPSWEGLAWTPSLALAFVRRLMHALGAEYQPFTDDAPLKVAPTKSVPIFSHGSDRECGSEPGGVG